MSGVESLRVLQTPVTKILDENSSFPVSLTKAIKISIINNDATNSLTATLELERPSFGETSLSITVPKGTVFYDIIPSSKSISISGDSTSYIVTLSEFSEAID